MTVQLNILRWDGFGECRVYRHVSDIMEISENGIRITYKYKKYERGIDKGLVDETAAWTKEQIFKMEIIP